jgi:NAD(P)-dependent dehydrogenase (short-subunit alcohol dehydrogenase family)
MQAASTAQPVALITGASAGIGLATARQLIADGWLVYGAARRTERMAGLEQAGARLLALDVTDDASCVAAIGAVRETAGRLDALVNNAGYGSYGAVEEVPLSEGRYQFEVNVFGLARLTQLALPLMRAQGSGRIVNISSMGGKIYEPLGAWYHATKFAVEGFSDSLRLELAPHGIHVIVIQPGGIKTEWGGIAVEKLLAASGGGPYAVQAREHAKVLAGSEGDGAGSPPEVIARLVSRALRDRRPRTRYSAGAGAKELLFLRKWTSDRGFDFVLRTLFAQLARQG